MNLAKIQVSGVRAVAVDMLPDIPAGIVGATVQLEYTGGIWTGLNKTVIFRGNTTKEVLANGDTVTVPAEVVAKPRGRLRVGIYGTDAANNIIMPTLWAELGGITDSAMPSEPTDSALPIWAQLWAMIGNLSNLDTEAKSSLVAAINELDEKTEPEEIDKIITAYLEKNPPVETDPTVPEWAKQPEKPSYTAEEVGALSPDDLQPGIDQALEQAKESGLFDGEPGKDGYTPAKRVDYPEIKVTHMAYPRKGVKIECQYDRPDGTVYFEGGTVYDGEDGDPGKSAYQYALEAGFEGTEEEFAEKLASSSGYPAPCVMDYGAVGDGVADDTVAFQTALAENRVVFVPGGTYKLSGGLVIGHHCELELSADTVLNFTQTTGNCITLGSISNLKGNHAVINVPYEFTGNVIYANSEHTTAAEGDGIEPWTKWSPLWKHGRYITDLNICKPDSRGFHYSVNGECNGTAVYIGANGSGGIKYTWGLNFSGLRIAGAFQYGIHGVCTNEGWVHEMRVDAFIDACEIGVSLENCNNTYISAVIQPRRAYTMDGVYIPNAKQGIRLVNCVNTDLSGSRVWDWDAEKTLFGTNAEYQHIAMYGDCSGAILNDFRFYGSGDTRDRIYTDTASNLDKLTIIQEPITRWFKTVDDVPHYFNGNQYEPLATKEELDEHFITDRVPTFTDMLSTSKDLNGDIYNGIGYWKGRGFDSSGNDIGGSAYAYELVTGFIPCKVGDVIRAQNIFFDKSLNLNAQGEYLGGRAGIRYYDANHNFLVGQTCVAMIIGGSTYYQKCEQTEDGFKITLNPGLTEKYPNTPVAYVRFCFYIPDFGENPVIAINENIGFEQHGFLADGIKVKGENVVGGPGGDLAAEPLVVTFTMTDEAAGNASHTAAEINAAYTSGRQVVAHIPYAGILTLIVPLIASADALCVFASSSLGLSGDTPSFVVLNVSDNGAAMLTMQEIELPDRLPNPWSLWIGDQKYDGSAYVDITDTVNSMIDAKLGVIENGTY